MSDNRYLDTRGYTKNPVSFTQAVVDGLANGGGLYVPESIPSFTLSEICTLAELPYAQRAATIYKAFGVDLPSSTIDSLMSDTYGSNFDSEEICPITSLDDNTHILELWHGPTSAFKDLALQCLPRFFSASVAQLREQGKLDNDFMILVATSGDTGKAALEGFKDLAHVSIGVMYPDGGVSDIQHKQMATQRGNNVQVWGVRGNFDDCQTGAKNVFGDKEFAQTLYENYGIALSSANSINWGRLLPQVVYYVSSYAQLVADKKIAAGDAIDVCVPTGNFGNILAAYYAKRMGTPIETLLCASNENCVLTDFITSGTYDISSREFKLTPSPSMDILVSSNLERQLFELTDRDASAISQWMSNLKEKRCFSVDEKTFARIKGLFKAASVDNATCLTTIKNVFDQHHYLLDPHTAVAYKAAEQLRSKNPVLIASTAHWAKFGNNVYRALHGIDATASLPTEVQSLTGCELNKLIAKETGCSNVPQGLAELDDLPIRFTDVIDSQTSDIERATKDFLQNLKRS